MKGKLPPDIKRILVRATNWLGDAVLTTPAICAVRETYPDAEITLLANSAVSELLKCHPCVDNLMAFDKKGKHNGIFGRLKLAAELRSKHFDLALIFPNSFDSALVPWLAGIPERWGKSSDGRGLLLTSSYSEPPGKTPVHEMQYYLELLAFFGIVGTDKGPSLYTTASEDMLVSEMLVAAGINDDTPVIGINAGASFGSAKRWYPERFARVAKALADEWGGRVILFGGKDEVDIVLEIEAALGVSCLNLAGKTSVRELMALIRRCSFFVTNDSGPMHIAAAFGVPLVAIFGPTDHAGTAPRGKNAVIVRAEIPCAPCKLRVCPVDHACMEQVKAEDVIEAAINLMKRVASRESLSKCQLSAE